MVVSRWSPFPVALFLVLIASATLMADDTSPGNSSPDSIRKAVTLYASFDESLKADCGGGALVPGTRFGTPSQPEAFVFEPEVDESVFRIAKDKGVSGGALEAVDVLPRSGRIYYPAKGNIAYDPKGWGGTVSFWLNTDPNTLLKTSFCDPVQITEKGAGNGGLWCDFPDTKPRDFRMGAFPSVPPGGKPIPESAQDAPLIRVEEVDFKQGQWRHVALVWNNFDTGRPEAEAVLYIDGKPRGRLADRDIAMRWNIDKAGIYFAVSYIGLLDELAVFNRPLTMAEVAALQADASLLSPLKSVRQ